MIEDRRKFLASATAVAGSVAIGPVAELFAQCQPPEKHWKHIKAWAKGCDAMAAELDCPATLEILIGHSMTKGRDGKPRRILIGQAVYWTNGQATLDRSTWLVPDIEPAEIAEAIRKECGSRVWVYREA